MLLFQDAIQEIEYREFGEDEVKKVASYDIINRVYPKPKGSGAETTLLISACEFHNRDAVKLLLEYGADPNLNVDDGTAMFMAGNSFFGPYFDTCILQALVDAGGDLSVTTEEGETPLSIACYILDVEAVKFFLEHDLDPEHLDIYGNNYKDHLEGVQREGQADPDAWKILKLLDDYIDMKYMLKNP